jgi:phytoene/squalene synthetase
MTAQLSPCGDLARHGDPERFHAALFAPAERREDLFVLLAFNYEIARVREIISEPLIGEMRLAWWHEVLSEIESGRGARPHPVAQGLDLIHRRGGLALDRLRVLIDARGFDQRSEPMADLPALKAYAGATGGALHRAMAASLGGDACALDAAEAGGTAFALTGMLRALSIHSARGQLYLPRRELIARGVSLEDVFGGKSSEGLRIVINEVIALARTHYEQARAANMGGAFPAILACASLRHHWRRMSRAKFDPFDQARDHGDVTHFIALLLASARGRI